MSAAESSVLMQHISFSPLVLYKSGVIVVIWRCEISVEKLISLIKFHQTFYNASDYEHTKRPAVTDGKFSQCLF
jgi:hypothetical protein